LIDTFKATFRKSCANLLLIKVEQNTFVQPFLKVAQKNFGTTFLKGCFIQIIIF